jgi:hypothetical protein
VTQPDSRSPHRLIEIITVLVLGITTLGTAWCSYEAYQWNSEQNQLGQDAASQQIEANRQFGLATQIIAYDTTMLGQYATAYRAGDQQLMQFYRTSLMRPGLLPFLDKWVAQVKSGKAPQNLLTDEAYMSATTGPYTAADAKAADLNKQSDEAGRVADRYLVTTILLAVGLFFGGMTSSFKWTPSKLSMIAFAVIAIGLAATRLVDLPVRL